MLVAQTTLSLFRCHATLNVGGAETMSTEEWASQLCIRTTRVGPAVGRVLSGVKPFKDAPAIDGVDARCGL